MQAPQRFRFSMLMRAYEFSFERLERPTVSHKSIYLLALCTLHETQA